MIGLRGCRIAASESPQPAILVRERVMTKAWVDGSSRICWEAVTLAGGTRVVRIQHEQVVRPPGMQQAIMRRIWHLP